MLDRILAEAARISGAPHVKVLLLDGAAGVLRVGALQGSAMPPGFALPVGVGSSGLVAQTGQPLYMADAQHDSRSIFAERDRELGIVTYLGLPIKRGDDVLGVLTFNTTVPRQYSPDELAYLTSFADQAAIAIENARLYTAAVRRAEEMQARVAERTRDLETANAKLAAASQHKSEFLASMSHEIRTPLNFILGFTQMLQEQGGRDYFSDKHLRFLHNVHTSGEHLLQLITDIVDLAKVEAGKFIWPPSRSRCPPSSGLSSSSPEASRPKRVSRSLPRCPKISRRLSRTPFDSSRSSLTSCRMRSSLPPTGAPSRCGCRRCWQRRREAGEPGSAGSTSSSP